MSSRVGNELGMIIYLGPGLLTNLKRRGTWCSGTRAGFQPPKSSLHHHEFTTLNPSEACGSGPRYSEAFHFPCGARLCGTGPHAPLFTLSLLALSKSKRRRALYDTRTGVTHMAFQRLAMSKVEWCPDVPPSPTFRRSNNYRRFLCQEFLQSRKVGLDDHRKSRKRYSPF